MSANKGTRWRALMEFVDGKRSLPPRESPIQGVENRPPARPRRERRPMSPHVRLRVQVRLYWALALLIGGVLTGALLAAALLLPPAGSADAPALNEVPQRYLDSGVEETGAVNAVTGLILDYRAFDTFGESTVLFAAAMSVVMVLGRKDGRAGGRPGDEILRRTGQLVLPVVLLFGLYVVVNGHLSPGGGFSGGAVLGGGLILACFVAGQERVERLLTPRRTTALTVGSLLVYAALKGYSFYTGANHVGWEVPKGEPGSIFSAGFILPLNLCVGLIVACTIFTFYSLFSREEE